MVVGPWPDGEGSWVACGAAARAGEVGEALGQRVGGEQQDRWDGDAEGGVVEGEADEEPHKQVQGEVEERLGPRRAAGVGTGGKEGKE